MHRFPLIAYMLTHHEEYSLGEAKRLLAGMACFIAGNEPYEKVR